ncbi:MAG TPA: isochorismatase family protein [Acidimicrobiales bacterium]|nr:isochorismatase family protein [Acidimicrobiales bacterium]
MTENDGQHVDEIWSSVIDQPTRALYSAYQRPRYVSENVAVLAIDLYKRVYRGGNRDLLEVTQEYPSSCGRYAWECREPTLRLLSAARHRGVPIFFSTGRLEREASKRPTMRQVGEADSSDDLEIMDGFFEEGDSLVEKDRASVFFDTSLHADLQRAKIDGLIVIGESTSGCVRASAVDAYSLGYHVVVAADCCFDRSQVSHKVSLFDLHHKYADVFFVDDVLEAMGDPNIASAVR